MALTVLFAILVSYTSSVSLSAGSARFHFPLVFGPIDTSLPYYGPLEQNLSVVDPAVTILLLVQHGRERTAEGYWNSARNAVKNFFTLNATHIYLAAPHFQIPDDATAVPTQMLWNETSPAPDWANGGDSASPVQVSTFAVYDKIIDAVVAQNTFPNLQTIIIIGHSAGGQFTQHYAMAGQAHRTLASRFRFRFVPANPGALGYLTPTRPVLAAAMCSDYCVADEILSKTFTFAVPSNCSRYDRWPTGISSLPTSGYNYVNLSQIASVYPMLDVRHLQGTNDVCAYNITETFGYTTNASCGCSDTAVPSTCGSDAQGYCRLMRGFAYLQNLKQAFPASPHTATAVPSYGHTSSILGDVISAGRIFSDLPCALSSWSPWSQNTCGFRNRTVLVAETVNGTPCSSFALTETSACTTSAVSGSVSLHSPLPFLYLIFFLSLSSLVRSSLI